MAFLVHKEGKFIVEKTGDKVWVVVSPNKFYSLYTRLFINNKNYEVCDTFEDALKYVELLKWLDKEIHFDDLHESIKSKILNTARFELRIQEGV